MKPQIQIGAPLATSTYMHEKGHKRENEKKQKQLRNKGKNSKNNNNKARELNREPVEEKKAQTRAATR